MEVQHDIRHNYRRNRQGPDEETQTEVGLNTQGSNPGNRTQLGSIKG